MIIDLGYHLYEKDIDGNSTYDLLKKFDLVKKETLDLLNGYDHTIAEQINKIDESGLNDVHRAIREYDAMKLRCLLEHGGNPNISSLKGDYPLDLAFRGNINKSIMLKTLIEFGGNISNYSENHQFITLCSQAIQNIQNENMFFALNDSQYTEGDNNCYFMGSNSMKTDYSDFYSCE